METITLKAFNPFSLQHIRHALASKWEVLDAPANSLIVNNVKSRAYLYEGSEPADLNAYYLFIDYADIELAKGIIELIADDPDITVDNDFGTVLNGHEFVARIRSKRGWNWRNDIS